MAHRPSCGAFALPAQSSSPSAPGGPARRRCVAYPRNAPAHPRPARRRCVRLPAQCSSPSMPGTSPVRLPARIMHQPIRARHVTGALPTPPGTSPVHPPARAMRQPAAWSSFHRKTVIPPRRHNITQSHHDSALSQTYNTAKSQCHCRTYAGSHRRRGASRLSSYPRSPISLKPGSAQSLRALHLCPADWTRCARPAHGMAGPNNLLHWDTFGVKIK